MITILHDYQLVLDLARPMHKVPVEYDHQTVIRRGPCPASRYNPKSRFEVASTISHPNQHGVRTLSVFLIEANTLS